MRVCNHIYKYIATERVQTDQWHYGEIIYKEEVITYCPLCHRHIRLSEDEWQKYKDYNKNECIYNENYIEEKPLITFNKNKKCTFTCENALFNLSVLVDHCLSVPVKDVKDIEYYYKRKDKNDS